MGRFVSINMRQPEIFNAREVGDPVGIGVGMGHDFSIETARGAGKGGR
jgi:hypothetical protein